MNTLSNKVALITGASSGIGWATAQAFAQRKCRLALAARRSEKLRELSQILRPAGVETLEITCDVRNPKEAKEAVEATVRKWGALDILVNNAGILEYKSFEDQDVTRIEDIMRTNYFGAVYMTHAALPHMRRQGQGHIVNVASVAGLLGIPYLAAYCASKYALVGLTESLRREYYGTGITLTALCPGIVDTPMAAQAFQAPNRFRASRPKAPQQVAEKIAQSVLRRTPEIIYGEIPGIALKLSRFFPALTDWATYRATRKI